MAKKRLDLMMVENGLAESRSLAQRLVMAGQVRVNGQMALKSSQIISSDASIELEQGPPFVSRGGEKLEAAIHAFYVVIEGRICADVGASTGGFTDCLLQHLARRVYAIDVGKGILHWKLRQDDRVVVLEGTNARHLKLLAEPVSLVTVDASFISLKILLPVIQGWFLNNGSAEHPDQVLALIKPQFEVGRSEAARGDGVIRDPEAHKNILHAIAEFASGLGFHVRGLIRSPLLGPKGNTEFLINLHNLPGTDPLPDFETVDQMIDRLFPEPAEIL